MEKIWRILVVGWNPIAMSQRRRYFSPQEQAELLAAIGRCREACVRASIAAPIGGDVYRSVDRLMTAIDDVAGVVTGDPSHFHLKSAPSRQKESPP